MSVPEGMVRVFPLAGLPGLRAHQWADMPVDDPRIRDWLNAGLLLLTGPSGEPPPAELPPRRCCG